MDLHDLDHLDGDAALLVRDGAVTPLNQRGRMDLGAAERRWDAVLAETHPQDREDLAALVEAVQNGSSSYGGPVRWRRHNLDPESFFAYARVVAHPQGATILVDYTTGPHTLPGELEAVLTSANDLAAVIDEKYRIRVIGSSADRLNFKAEDIYGLDINEVLHSRMRAADGSPAEGVTESPEARAEALLSTRTHGRIRRGLFDIKDGSGNDRVIEVYASFLGSGVLPPYDGDGWSDGYLVVAHDITAHIRFEEAAAASERRLATLLANSADVLCVIRADLTVDYASRSAQELFGVDLDHIVGAPVTRWLSEVTAKGLVAAAAENLRGDDGTWTQRSVVQRADGTKRQVELAVSDQLDDPAINGLVINIRDISDRILSADALRKSEAQATTVLETLSEGVIVMDADTTITQVNKSAAAILETEAAELLGRHTYDVGWRFVTRDGTPIDELAVPYSQTRRTGAAVDPVVLGMITRRGSPVRWVRVSSRPVTRPDGRFDVIVTLANVSAQVVAQAQLRNSERWYRALVQNAYEAAFVSDLDGTITYVSPAVERLLGWPVEHYGPPESVVVHPDDVAALRAAETQASAEPGVGVPATYRALHADGTWRWINSHILDATSDPAIQGVITNSRDVTEQVEAVSALQASEDRFRTAFSSSPLGMALVDADGNIEDANESLHDVAYSARRPRDRTAIALSGIELLGGTLVAEEDGDITGASLSHILNADVDPVLSEVMISGDVISEEVATRDGRWLTVTANVAYDSEGAFQHVVVHVADITAMREARETVIELNHQLSAVLASLSSEREAERRRIAVGLHDNAVQALVAARWTSARVASETDPKLRQQLASTMSDALSSAIDSLRALIFDLRPPLLDEGGLTLAVAQLVEHAQRQVMVELHDDLDGVRVHPDVENLVFRTCQESLRNVIKHAEATRVVVRLTTRNDRIEGVVADNGRGVARPDLAAKASGGHIGVVSMRETLSSVGGTFSISNGIEGGATVRFSVPVDLPEGVAEPLR